MKLVALPLLLLLLTACGEKVAGAPEPGTVIDVPAFRWHVVDRAALERAYTEDAGLPLGKGEKLEGFVGVLEDGTHVIYTLPPQRVDDAATTTLGHEVLHLAIGAFHK